MSGLKKELRKLKNPVKAKDLSRFFKTNKGEYGEGDKFLGIPVPELRKLAKKYKDIDLSELSELCLSEWHEERMTAFIILDYKYAKAKTDQEKKTIFDFYLKYKDGANNWDIVDVTCRAVLGDYIFHHPENKDLLYKMARSKNLWHKRLAIISTFFFIKQGQFEDSLKLSELLLHDKHDLIHKAVGWTLREVGNKDKAAEEEFLKVHYKTMPRTALRYAIEKFPEEQRKKYLNKKN